MQQENHKKANNTKWIRIEAFSARCMQGNKDLLVHMQLHMQVHMQFHINREYLDAWKYEIDFEC